MRRWLIVFLLLGCLGITLPAGAQGGGSSAPITLENVAELTQLPTLIVPPSGVVDFAYSPDGQTIGVAGYFPGNGLWNATSGQLIRMLEEFVGGSGNTIAFSPDGTRVAIANSLIIVWDTATGEVLAQYEEYARNKGGISELAFTPDGAFLGAAYYDGSIRLWDVATGERAQIFEGRLLDEDVINSGFRSLAFSSDGRLVVGGECLAETKVGNSASCDEGALSVFDVQTGDLLQTLGGQWSIPRFLAFSPDGSRLLMVNDYDRAIQVWDVASWELVETLEFSSMVIGLAFSPDGSLLATATHDVQVWDVATGEAIFTASGLLRPDMTWTPIAFNPDGTRLAVYDGTQIVQWSAGQGGGGPLQIVLTLDDSPFSERFTQELPADWLASNPEGVRFEVRVTSATFQYDSCSYSEGHLLIRQGTNSTVTLVDRESGRQIANRTFNGPQFDYRACESWRDFDEMTEYQTVSLPDRDELQMWLVSRLNWLLSASSLGWANGVNLRAEPNTSADILGVTSASDPILLVGRNEAGDWLRVRAAVGEGGVDVEAWIFRELVSTEADLTALPVVG